VATITLLYFASVRETVGLDQETIYVPDTTQTVSELVIWLQQRGPNYRAAFAETEKIRSAVDQQHVDFDASIKEAREIAFFPPVTGG